MIFLSILTHLIILNFVQKNIEFLIILNFIQKILTYLIILNFVQKNTDLAIIHINEQARRGNFYRSLVDVNNRTYITINDFLVIIHQALYKLIKLSISSECIYFDLKIMCKKLIVKART